MRRTVGGVVALAGAAVGFLVGWLIPVAPDNEADATTVRLIAGLCVGLAVPVGTGLLVDLLGLTSHKARPRILIGLFLVGLTAWFLAAGIFSIQSVAVGFLPSFVPGLIYWTLSFRAGRMTGDDLAIAVVVLVAVLAGLIALLFLFFYPGPPAAA